MEGNIHKITKCLGFLQPSLFNKNYVIVEIAVSKKHNAKLEEIIKETGGRVEIVGTPWTDEEIKEFQEKNKEEAKK